MPIEKVSAQTECCENSGSGTGILILLNVIAMVFLAGIFFLAKAKNIPKIDIEKIRRIYEGLPPEENN